MTRRQAQASTAPRPLSLGELAHWEASGAGSRIVDITGGRATVELCTCTGELVERREVIDPALIERLRERRSGDTDRW